MVAPVLPSGSVIIKVSRVKPRGGAEPDLTHAQVPICSLRSRAIILVQLAILPLLALTIYSYLEKRAEAVVEVQRDELVAVRNLAVIQETLIRSSEHLLTSLSGYPRCSNATGWPATSCLPGCWMNLLTIQPWWALTWRVG